MSVFLWLVGLALLIAPPSSQTDVFRNQLGMEFVRIPAGTFRMGAPAQTPLTQPDELPARRVTISKPFWMCRTEVTQEQWKRVMGYNQSSFKDVRNLKLNRRFQRNPTENVSWEEIQEFIRLLNVPEGRNVYRLPTEAEWEYAYRAGGQTPENLGASPELAGKHAWYEVNARQTTHPVGTRKANGFGLYDMDGNVCEWVADWYTETCSAEPQVDPRGPENGLSRVFRGSSWNSVAQYLRASQRYCLPPNFALGIVGFRLCRDVDPVPAGG